MSESITPDTRVARPNGVEPAPQRPGLNVAQLITAAFGLAACREPGLHQTWVTISIRVGGLLPNSLLDVSLRRLGNLDMVLTCMEDDFRLLDAQVMDDGWSFNYQKMLSELWVGAMYEIFRLLAERKLIVGNEPFETIAHDLRLLRIPIEKYQIAWDNKLSQPLEMRRHPLRGDSSDDYTYSKGDSQRAHIMPSGVSSRGSVMWQVMDLKDGNPSWLERRSLSERIVALWSLPIPSPASARRGENAHTPDARSRG